MAKISQYPEGIMSDDDFIVFTDTSENATKKQSWANMINRPAWALEWQALIYNWATFTAQNQSVPYVSVWFDNKSDYKCDGTADNVQIQAAIDAVTTNWGTILIKEGTYNFADKIQLKSNVRIIWTWAGTILKAGGSHGGVIYQGSTIAPVNASIEAITIDANNIANVSAVQIYKFNGLKIKDCTVKNVNGIWGLKLWDYWADPVTAKSYWLEICNLKIDNANSWTYEPLLTSNTDGINIDGLNVSNCDLTNASLVSIFLLSKNVRITNSYFKSVTDDFGLLDITGSDNVVVTWNTFIHDGTTWNNAIVNRNTNNVLISWNTLNGKTMSWAGGAWVIVLDWSGTIDGHTNPYPYTENISILNNVFSGFYYWVNFSNTDSSTNCGAKNVNITWNQFIGFDFSALTTRHVSGRDSENLVFSSNIVKPRTAGDKNLVWFRASGSYQNKKCVFIGNTFMPTTSDNTSVFVFEKADNVSFWPNYTEARWTWTVYSLWTSTNVTYTTWNNTWDETNSTILSKIGYTPANDTQVMKLSGNQSATGRKHFYNNDTFLGDGAKSYVNIGNLGTSQEVYIDSRSDVYADVDLYVRAKGGNGDIRLVTNGNTRQTVLANWNVWIWEDSPDYKLDINGSLWITPWIGTTVTPVDNWDLVFETTSNTSVNLKLKGSDGVVRTFPITLSWIAWLIITWAVLELVYWDVINVLTIIQNIPS